MAKINGTNPGRAGKMPPRHSLQTPKLHGNRKATPSEIWKFHEELRSIASSVETDDVSVVDVDSLDKESKLLLRSIERSGALTSTELVGFVSNFSKSPRKLRRKALKRLGISWRAKL